MPERKENKEYFAKFSPEARIVFNHSQEEVQRFRHNYIGTEHLLLGLLRGSQDDPAVVALNRANVDLNKGRSAVEFIIGRGERDIHGDIGLTPRAKRVIEIAVENVPVTQQITTSNLLKGIILGGPSIAVSILEVLNVNLKELANSIGTTFNEPASEPEITGEEFEKMLAENIQKGREAKLIKKGEKLESLEYRDRNSVDSLISFLSDTDITRADKDFVNDILSKIVWRVQK